MSDFSKFYRTSRHNLSYPGMDQRERDYLQCAALIIPEFPRIAAAEELLLKRRVARDVLEKHKHSDFLSKPTFKEILGGIEIPTANYRLLDIELEYSSGRNISYFKAGQYSYPIYPTDVFRPGYSWTLIYELLAMQLPQHDKISGAWITFLAGEKRISRRIMLDEKSGEIPLYKLLKIAAGRPIVSLIFNSFDMYDWQVSGIYSYHNGFFNPRDNTMLNQVLAAVQESHEASQT